MSLDFFSFNNKINKKDSTVMIKSIRSLMGLGNSLFEAIKLQQEIETGKNAKIIKKIIYMVEEKNYSLEKLLYQYGIIDNSEYLILANSKDTKESLESIIKLRSVNSNFDKTLISLLSFPIAGFFIGIGIAKFLLPSISKPVNDLVKIAKIKKGIDIDETMNVPPSFYYIHHPEYVNYVFFGGLFLMIALFLTYQYLKKENPSVLYKIMPLKAYDDIPFIFILMRSLNKGGLDLYTIADKLYKSDIGKGWKIFFLRLKRRIEKRGDIYPVFKNFGFPKQIYLIIKVSEKSKAFWENFDNMITYSQEVNTFKNEEIRDRWKSITVILGYVEVIYYIVGILLLMLSMQNIVTALQ